MFLSPTEHEAQTTCTEGSLGFVSRVKIWRQDTDGKIHAYDWWEGTYSIGTLPLLLSLGALAIAGHLNATVNVKVQPKRKWST